jgi:hypothetical protein
MAPRKRRNATVPQLRQLRRRDNRRLRRDIATAIAEFPSLQLVEEVGGKITLQGEVPVTIGTKHGIIRTANITVRFVSNYPKSEPQGWIEPGTFNSHDGKTFFDRHIASDGRCCLDLPVMSSWTSRDPDALVKWLCNFVLFVHRQFIYDLNGGRWPGPEWKHGSHGWAQYVVEQVGPNVVPTLLSVFRGNPPPRKSPCPCGSAIIWAHCHKRSVNDIIKALPFDDRQEIMKLLDNTSYIQGNAGTS